MLGDKSITQSSYIGNVKCVTHCVCKMYHFLLVETLTCLCLFDIRSYVLDNKLELVMSITWLNSDSCTQLH